MSDENEHEHEHPQGFVFPFQLGPSPEMVERMRMNQEANAHETRQFFDSLNADQLRKLSGLFSMCYTSEGDAAQYFIGLISGFLDQKFKLCLACGKDHDKELNDFAPTAPTQLTGEDRVALMREYNVSTDGDEFFCSECKTPIASLEDRMLRKPGKAGCETCIQREKWG